MISHTRDFVIPEAQRLETTSTTARSVRVVRR